MVNVMMILSFEKHRVRIMFEITRVESQIIEIRHSGAFRIEQAKEYQHLMTAMLSQGSGLLYVLGNFKNTTSFEKPVLRELGLFSFLMDQRLGMLVLIGDDPLTKFVLSITELQARQDNRNLRLRVHHDYNQALDLLRTALVTDNLANPIAS